MVQQLMDPNSGEWLEDVLAAKFESIDVNAIMKIHTGRLEEDVWAWHLEKHGNFTVRSAYRALLQESGRINQSTSSGGGEYGFWKKLWKLKVPPKVRNFWWRVIKGYIPCRQVLKARHIERLDRCRACGEVESIHHALFDCTWAKLFWQEIRVVLSVKIPSLHPATWAIDIIDSNKVVPRVAAIILCGGWAVWAERNARDHGESTRSIAQSVKWTTDITRDLAESIRVKTSGHPKRRSKWRRPEEGVIKVNVDAGFDLNNGEGSS
jgi:hypothetical protein